MNQIEIGLIGCGHWGANYARILTQSPSVSRLHCFDLDSIKLIELKKRFPEIEITHSAQSLIEHLQIKALVIATPASTHETWVKSALNANKDVLCEKPLTLDSASAISIDVLAKSKRRILMIGHTFLYNVGIQAIKALIQKGELGHLYYLSSTRTNLGPVRHDANAIEDLGTHDFSIFNFLLNETPLTVSATGQAILQAHLVDTAFITCQYPEHIMAHSHVSWLNPVKVRQLIVVGSKKMVLWDDMNPREPLKIYESELEKEPLYQDFRQFRLLPQRGKLEVPQLSLSEPLKNQVEVFLKAIVTRDSPYSNGTFSSGIVKILEAANSSLAMGGQAVKLEDLT